MFAGNAGTAAQAQSEASEVEDRIVVTATKREQSIQDVSSAISAVSPDLLWDAQIGTLEDLQVAVPGLTIGNDFAFAKIYVRGIGLNSSLPGLDPSVALHVDGAVVSQASQQFASLFDLQRVELLRGPQGTLYGRNATGGSINLVTAKPTEDYEGYANFTVGGPDLNFISEGAVSGPITNNIQGRLAMRFQDREGYGTYTRTGEDVDNANKVGLRGQVNFDLTDRISNLVSAEYYREDERSKAVKFYAPSFEPSVIDALRADTTLDPALAAQIDNLVSLAGPDALANSRDVGGDVVPAGDLETSSLTNTFDFNVNDTFSFRSITNYREGESTLIQDFDVSNVVNGVDTELPSTVQLQQVDNEQFSQEFQVLLDGARWRGLIGGYYFNEQVAATVPIGTDPEAVLANVDVRGIPNEELGALLPDARVVIPGDMDIQATAVFANFTYDLTNSLRIKLGARYSEEERDIAVSTRLPGPGITIPGSDSRDYSDFTPEIGFEYDIGDSLLYFTYSEGFKSGTAALVDGSPELIDPETIENFEAGLKGVYLDGALSLGLAGFVYTVEDAQFDRTRLTAAGARFTTSVENAATTDGMGIEIEGGWQATSDFRLDFYGTWYDIEYDEFITTNPIEPFGALEGLAGVDVRTVDLSGNRPRNTPEYSFQFRGTYTQSLANGGLFDYSAAYAYKGDQYFTEFNEDRMSADAYGILDANVKYTFPNSAMTLNAWGKNLTDEFVGSGAFAISTSRTITGTYLPPRSYGVTLGYQF